MPKASLIQFQNITNGAMVGDITSLVTSIVYLDDIALQFNITGTPTGIIAPQISLDYKQDFMGNVLVAGNWIPVQQPDGSPVQIAVVAGSPSNSIINMDFLAGTYLRVVYTHTSGTGTLNGFLSAKRL